MNSKPIDPTEQDERAEQDEQVNPAEKPAPEPAAADPAAPTTPEPSAAPEPPAEMRTIEAWAELRRTPKWLLDATRAGRRWPAGQELTAEAFDRACTDTTHEGIR